MAKRRKRGEGSVRLRKDGRWEGRYVVGRDAKGLPITRNVLAKTKRECVEKLEMLRESLAVPQPEGARADMPFGDWVTFWYENYAKPGLRPTTQQRYEELIRLHLVPGAGHIPLNKLAQSDLRKFYLHLKEHGRKKDQARYGEGLSDRTVRSCHALCRSALERAVAEKLISKNPAIGCKLPPSRPKEMKVLTGEEMQRLLIQAKEEGYYELFILELATGLRRGELLALQWDDLNFKTGELHIQRQVGRVERVESKKQPKGLSAKTVRNINQVISSAMDFAREQRLIATNPTDGCALPKLEHREMQTLTADQLAAFLREAKASGVYELYYIELATGLRRGELLGLKWEDVNFEQGVLHVRRQVARINGEIVEAPLKTKNSYRSISIGADAVGILKQQQEKTASEYVFPSPTGSPISPDSVGNMFHRVLKRAGLPKVRFHGLRHTYATLAIQNGVDAKTVSSVLGHYSAGFTLDTYTHTAPAMQQAAAEKVGSFIAKAV